MPTSRFPEIIRNPRSILITGASRGIGAALARAYAAPGVALALTARDEARLAAIAAACREAGAEAVTASLDVTEVEPLRAWMTGIDSDAPLDLVIANAGVTSGAKGAPETSEQSRRVFSVNVGGVLNTVHPAIELMRSRNRGQIAIMGSLTSFRGFPSAVSYSASKAAVKAYGEALRGALHRDGIAVSVIFPGFIDTAMTASNEFRMPLLMEADRAAQIIKRGLARDRPRIGFPWPLYLGAWLIGAAPAIVGERLLRLGPR